MLTWVCITEPILKYANKNFGICAVFLFKHNNSQHAAMAMIMEDKHQHCVRQQVEGDGLKQECGTHAVSQELGFRILIF